MKNSLARLLFLAIFTLTSLTACTDNDKDNSSNEPSDIRTISLIGFNDFHGRLENGGTALVDDPQNPAGTKVSLGGAASLASAIKALKSENPEGSIVIANGDLIGATPLISRSFYEEPTIDVLNQLGLEVSSVGNHEFDRGKTELLRLANGGCAPQGTVGKDTCLINNQFKGAQFQYLAANVIDQSTGSTLLPAYIIKNINGVQVAFIGLTLKDTPSVVAAGGTDGLAFRDEVQTVNALIPEVKQKGAQIIIVLLHQGGVTDSNIITQKTCNNLDQEIVHIVDSLSPEINVVYNAHTHWGYICDRQDGKLLVSSASYGMLLSKVDLEFDVKQGKVRARNANNIPVLNGNTVKAADGSVITPPAHYKTWAQDADIAARVAFYKNKIAPIAEEVIGSITQAIERTQNAAGEAPLANLNADIYLWETSARNPAYADHPADLAFENQGGVRADLERLQVTFGDATNVLPFGNQLLTKDLTGAQVVRLLEQQWEQPQPSGNTRVLAVSSNVSYTWDNSQPEGAPSGTGQRVLVSSIRINGQPIDLNKTYRVTATSYIAEGGDNMSTMLEGRNPQLGRLDVDIVKDYFKAMGTVAYPLMGRITRSN